LAILSRISKAWNAFKYQQEEQYFITQNIGPSATVRSHVNRPRYTNERTIISSIYTRIGIDFSAINIRHIKTDEIGRYAEDAKSSLNKCLNYEPNIDQSPRAFRQDIATTLFDKGVAAIVAVDTAINPAKASPIEIFSLRVGEVKEWFPKHVRVSLYNEATGLREEIILEKRFVAIVENPLYAVMNEPNSTLQRLIRKLHLWMLLKSNLVLVN